MLLPALPLLGEAVLPTHAVAVLISAYPELYCVHCTQDQLAACTSLYVEDQLSVHFRDLVEFVKKAEQQQKRNAVPDGQPIAGNT